MNLLEKCVVTTEFCKRKDVYNILEGGHGGWNGIRTKESCRRGQLAMIRKMKSTNTYKNGFLEFKKSMTKKQWKDYVKTKGWSKRERETYCGKNNSMYQKHPLVLSNF